MLANASSLPRREPRAGGEGYQLRQPRDAGDPWKSPPDYEQEGADELVFLVITASHEGRDIILDVVRRTAEVVICPNGRGGIRTMRTSVPS